MDPMGRGHNNRDPDHFKVVKSCLEEPEHFCYAAGSTDLLSDILEETQKTASMSSNPFKLEQVPFLWGFSFFNKQV